MNSHRGPSGFTLLEVLVALAVLALALAAVIQTAARQADQLAYLRDQTLAQWVAVNQHAQMRLEAEWPEPGDYRGEADMAGRVWHWRAEVGETPDQALREINLRVYPREDAEEPLAQIKAYLAKGTRSK